MTKYYLTEPQINFIFSHKYLVVDKKRFIFDAEKIKLLRKLFKKSKYYK